MSDSTQRFTDRVGDYARYRPSYPAALLDDLDRLVWDHQSVVADVGAGTGLFTRMVAPRVSRVWALEPNDAMRLKGQADSAGFENMDWGSGTAETTGLPENCLDAVVCAQAFHWFEPRKTAEEWRRILKPGRPVVLVWNERDETQSPLQTAYHDLLNRWCPEYPRVNHKNIKPADIEAFFTPHAVTVLTHRNDQRFDLEGWKGRLRSASYCPLPGQAGHLELMEGLGALYLRFQDSQGLITFPYQTLTYLGHW